MIRSTLLVSAISAILMTSALAQTKPLFPPLIDTRGTPDDQEACKHDAVTLCKSVLGDDMAVLACFQRQRAKLSKSCNAVLVKYGQ
jgi:hypothetical protein